MKRLRTHLAGLPRGVPQIYGAVLALVILLPLAALHIHIGAFTFAVNWTSVLVFIGLSAVLAIVWSAASR
jgi:hypothetical protein